MSDESIRTLFDKVDDLTVQVTEIKTLLINSVIKNQNRNSERLDRHRAEINKAFKEIEQIKNDIENTKGTAITLKNIVVGGIGLVATCTAIAVGITQLIINLGR